MYGRLPYDRATIPHDVYRNLVADPFISLVNLLNFLQGFFFVLFVVYGVGFSEYTPGRSTFALFTWMVEYCLAYGLFNTEIFFK